MSVLPGDTKLVRRGFSGCLRDVSLKMTDNPLEEWILLDWKKATKKLGVYESWEGCPLHTVEGVHFLGDGRILLLISLIIHLFYVYSFLVSILHFVGSLHCKLFCKQERSALWTVKLFINLFLPYSVFSSFVIKKLMWKVCLLAGYLELDAGVFSGGQNFDISMDFRTDQLSALLLFTYSSQTDDYMLVRYWTYLKQVFKEHI